MLHNIREDGPLVEMDDVTGNSIDDLEWKRDTPHPQKREDDKVIYNE